MDISNVRDEDGYIDLDKLVTNNPVTNTDNDSSKGVAETIADYTIDPISKIANIAQDWRKPNTNQDEEVSKYEDEIYPTFRDFIKRHSKENGEVDWAARSADLLLGVSPISGGVLRAIGDVIPGKDPIEKLGDYVTGVHKAWSDAMDDEKKDSYKNIVTFGANLALPFKAGIIGGGLSSIGLGILNRYGEGADTEKAYQLSDITTDALLGGTAGLVGNVLSPLAHKLAKALKLNKINIDKINSPDELPKPLKEKFDYLADMSGLDRDTYFQRFKEVASTYEGKQTINQATHILAESGSNATRNFFNKAKSQSNLVIGNMIKEADLRHKAVMNALPENHALRRIIEDNSRETVEGKYVTDWAKVYPKAKQLLPPKSPLLKRLKIYSKNLDDTKIVGQLDGTVQVVIPSEIAHAGSKSGYASMIKTIGTNLGLETLKEIFSIDARVTKAIAKAAEEGTLTTKTLNNILSKTTPEKASKILDILGRNTEDINPHGEPENINPHGEPENINPYDEPEYNPHEEPNIGSNRDNIPDIEDDFYSYGLKEEPNYDTGYVEPKYYPHDEPEYNPDREPENINPYDEPEYNPNIESEYNPNRESGYNPNRESGYNPNRESGYNPQEDDFIDAEIVDDIPNNLLEHKTDISKEPDFFFGDTKNPFVRGLDNLGIKVDSNTPMPDDIKEIMTNLKTTDPKLIEDYYQKEKDFLTKKFGIEGRILAEANKIKRSNYNPERLVHRDITVEELNLGKYFNWKRTIPSKEYPSLLSGNDLRMYAEQMIKRDPKYGYLSKTGRYMFKKGMRDEGRKVAEKIAKDILEKNNISNPIQMIRDVTEYFGKDPMDYLRFMLNEFKAHSRQGGDIYSIGGIPVGIQIEASLNKDEDNNTKKYRNNIFSKGE